MRIEGYLRFPLLFWEATEDIVVLGVEFDVVGVEVGEKIVCAEDFGDLLIVRSLAARSKGTLKFIP
jgi:hypothetical protein